jgi:capsular polysaccharide biosynthesis protein
VLAGPLQDMMLSAKGARAAGPAVLCPDTGYYHWLHEILPNLLHILDHVQVSSILVSSSSRPYVTQALTTLLGESRYPETVQTCSGSLSIDRLVMIPVTDHSGFCHPADLKRLNDEARKIFPHSRGKRRLYISRSEAPSRHVANEAELVPLLENLGFETIRPEGMPFRDQVALFSEAGAIAAPHGAGLANMVWKSGPCRVVEMMPPTVNDVYARMAVSLGFDYKVIPMDGSEESITGPVDKVIETVRAVVTG